MCISVGNAEYKGSVFLLYKEDRESSSRAIVWNLLCWDVFLQLYSEAFLFSQSGLVDGPCRYFYVEVLEGDPMRLRLMFRKSDYLLSNKL